MSQLFSLFKDSIKIASKVAFKVSAGSESSKPIGPSAT
jgi:hypothetical protein